MSEMLCASFPCSNFSTFLPIFSCNPIPLLSDTDVYAKFDAFLLNILKMNRRISINILKMNRRISIKFWICIDIYIYMIYIYPVTFCFSLFFNRVMALDLCAKCVSPKYLPNKWLHFEKILLVLLSKFKMHTKSECSGGVSW